MYSIKYLNIMKMADYLNIQIKYQYLLIDHFTKYKRQYK